MPKRKTDPSGAPGKRKPPTPKTNTAKPAGSQQAGRATASGRRRYSDEEKGMALAALDAKGGNVLGTAEDLGIPRKTLEGWAKDRDNAAVAEIRQVKKAELAEKYGMLAEKLVDRLLKEVDNLPVGQLAVNAGITTEKWLLLNDMPTGIQKVTGFEDMPDDELDRLLDED